MSAGQVYPPSEPLTGQPAPLSGQSVNIRQCPCCDGSHDGLDVREFAKSQGPFTHWFLCPTLGEPVSISLLMLSSGEGLELNGAVCQSIAKAQLSGRYLIAVFVISAEGKLELHRTSQKFPTGDFEECVNMLRKNLSSETGPAQPLQMQRGRPMPLRTLMGALDPGGKAQQFQLPGRPVEEITGEPEMLPEMSADKAAPVG